MMRRLKSKAGYQNELLVLAVFLGVLLAIFGKLLGKVGALIGLGVIVILFVLGVIYDPKSMAGQSKESDANEDDKEGDKS